MKLKMIHLAQAAVLLSVLPFGSGCFFEKEHDSTQVHMGLELYRDDSLQFRLERVVPIDLKAYSWEEGTLAVTLLDPIGNRLPIQVEWVPEAQYYRPFLLPDSSAYQADNWSLVAQVRDESGTVLADTLTPCCRFGLN